MPHATLSDDMAGYRPVSGLAVAAVIVGLGSALVLFTPLAAMVPLVAVALSVAALRDLSRAGGRQVGRPLALAGLALAIGFATQAVAATLTERVIAGRRAAETATAWLDAVRENRPTDAMGICNPLSLPARGRPPLGPQPTAEDQLAAFTALPAVQAVTGCGETRPPLIDSRPAQIGAAAWVVRADTAACDEAAAVVRLVVEPRIIRRPDGTFERWLVQEMAVEP